MHVHEYVCEKGTSFIVDQMMPPVWDPVSPCKFRVRVLFMVPFFAHTLDFHYVLPDSVTYIITKVQVSPNTV